MKPKEGDIVKVLDRISSLGDANGQEFWRVVAVYDHYRFDEPGGDWGDDGELAWSQKDHDEITGKTGEWYVIVENIKYPGETMSLASYECEVVTE